MNYFKESKGFSLISVIFALIGLSLLALTLGSLLGNRARGSVEDLQGQQAFFVADGGLQYILMSEFRYDQDFSNNISPTGNPYGPGGKALGMGQFWAQYANQSLSSVDVIITGRVGNSVRVIRQSVAKTPYQLGSDLYSGKHVTLSGRGTANGGIYAEGIISTPPPSFTVNGVMVQGTNLPNIPVDVTTIVTNIKNGAPQTISGTYALPSNFNGYIRVTGNVTIPDGTTVTGTVSTDGNIYVLGALNLQGTLAASGNIEASEIKNSVYQPQNGQTLPVLVSEGNIFLTAGDGYSPNVTGQITVGGNLLMEKILNGTFTFTGGISVNNNVTITGPTSGGMIILNLSSPGLQLTQWREE
jgi:cytoskeletal protein CcmA (bactofilin family)